VKRCAPLRVSALYFEQRNEPERRPLPDTPPSTLSNTQPGFVPKTSICLQCLTNTYSTLPSDNENYEDEWQDLNLNQFAPISHRRTQTASFGPAERDTYPKFFGHSAARTIPNFIPTRMLGGGDRRPGQPRSSVRRQGQPVIEDVNAMLIRAVRWFLDQSKCDGFRLDDVKGVPSYFFGDQGYSDTNKDTSTAGYCGAIQEQFNITHGYSSWNNLRASLFNDQLPRDNAMLWAKRSAHRRTAP